MNAKTKKYTIMILFIVVVALVVIRLCFTANRPSSSAEAAIHNIRMIEEALASNGYVKVGNAWGLPDKTNAPTQADGTNLISK